MQHFSASKSKFNVGGKKNILLHFTFSAYASLLIQSLPVQPLYWILSFLISTTKLKYRLDFNSHLVYNNLRTGDDFFADKKVSTSLRNATTRWRTATCPQSDKCVQSRIWLKDQLLTDLDFINLHSQRPSSSVSTSSGSLLKAVSPYGEDKKSFTCRLTSSWQRNLDMLRILLVHR